MAQVHDKERSLQREIGTRVEAALPDVEVLAAVDGRPVLCRQGPVIASAFHPELSDDLRLHRLFLDTVKGI